MPVIRLPVADELRHGRYPLASTMPLRPAPVLGAAYPQVATLPACLRLLSLAGSCAFDRYFRLSYATAKEQRHRVRGETCSNTPSNPQTEDPREV